MTPEHTDIELQQRYTKIAALNVLLAALAQPEALTYRLNLALDTLSTTLGATASCIYVLEKKTDAALSLLTHQGLPPCTLDLLTPLPLRGDTIPPYDERPHYDIAAIEQHYLNQTRKLTKRYYWLGKPLFSKGNKLLGWLALFRDTKTTLATETLAPWQVEFLDAASQHLGAVIEQEQRVEEKVKAQITQEVNRLRGELINNISHELRTPLGLIKAASNTLLAEDVSFDTQTQYQLLSGIDAETSRLEQIIKNLLRLSQIEQGRLRLDRHPTDMKILICKVIKAMPELAHYRIVNEFPSAPLIATVDAESIERVVHNLLDNAIKYSDPHSTIIIRGKHYMEKLRPSPQVLISVSDEGIGLAQADLEKVFERFYKVESTDTRAINRVGLGLTISRGIIEAHGGRIWVESTLGTGSTFYFTVPEGHLNE